MNTEAIGEKWTAVEASLGIQAEDCWYICPDDPEMRVYIAGAQVYKIELKKKQAEPVPFPVNMDLAQEGALLQEIQDMPGVVKFAKLRIDERFTALVVEKVDGIILSKQRFGPLGFVACNLRIVWTLLRLSYRKISHNDLTPRNIMVTPGGAPVLLDFGSSRKSTRLRALYSNFLKPSAGKWQTSDKVYCYPYLLTLIRMIEFHLPASLKQPYCRILRIPVWKELDGAG